MLQLFLFLLAIVCFIVVVAAHRKKGLRAIILRVISTAMFLCFTGVGVALVPAPLTADDGVQRANFVGTDMSKTEELKVLPLEAYPDGNYILVEETDGGQYIRFILAEDGIERRVPSEEVIFSSNESFGYETPVIRYGRSYLNPENQSVTFMRQRWDFIHFIVDPEYFSIWAG